MLPWFISGTAGQRVSNAFDDSFGGINGELSQSGVFFQGGKTQPCHAVDYHYLKMTIHCVDARAIKNGDNNAPIPSSLITSWPVVLRSLSVGAGHESWQVDKSGTNMSDPSNLFKFTGISRSMVGFTRNVNGVRCTLTVTADPAQGPYKSDYLISEECNKDVKIFGGWNCSVDSCKE